MNLVDTNVLVYAVNSASSQHETSRAWMERALSGMTPVGFAWVALLGFIRICTQARFMDPPLAVGEAFGLVDDWLAADPARVVSPTARHADLLAGFLERIGSGGNLVNDAHLAALAIEHRAEVISYDTDFARFPGVRWSSPAG